MKSLVLFVILVFAAPGGLLAKTSVATQNLLKASLDRSKLDTQEGRLALARSVNQYCVELQQAYPTNSPSEDQWLEREIAGDSARIVKTFSTAEFGRRKAKAFLDECVPSAEWAVKSPEKSIYFMVLTHAFLRFSDDAVYYAKLNGVDPENSWLEGLPKKAAEALSYSAIMIEVTKK